MALDLLTADAVLKDDYQDMRHALNNSFWLLQQIEKNTKDVVGEKAVHTVHVTRNSGVGARKLNASIPNAGNQGYIRVNVPQRRIYATIQIEKSTIAAMATDRGSFIRAVEGETDGAEKDLRRDVNRQMWGTSNGVIAACGVTSATTTLTLAGTTTRIQMRQLWNDGGMRVDIGTVANPTLRCSDNQVTDADFDARTLTLATAVTTDTDDRVFRHGAGGATDNSGNVNDGQAELTGLQTIVDDATTLHTVSASTNRKWRATAKSNSGTNRHPSETLINTTIQDVQIEASAFIEILVANQGVVNNIAADMRAMRRNNDTVELKGGFKGIKWNVLTEAGATGERALVLEQDCPPNRLFGLTPEDLVLYEMSDWAWDDTGGILKQVDGKDAVYAYYRAYKELACKNRVSHFVIEDLSEATA